VEPVYAVEISRNGGSSCARVPRGGQRTCRSSNSVACFQRLSLGSGVRSCRCSRGRWPVRRSASLSRNVSLSLTVHALRRVFLHSLYLQHVIRSWCSKRITPPVANKTQQQPRARQNPLPHQPSALHLCTTFNSLIRAFPARSHPCKRPLVIRSFGFSSSRRAIFFCSFIKLIPHYHSRSSNH
jgi:hypothetical protein